MEPLLSVTWLLPEGWSLALRSRRSEPGPCKEVELLYLGSLPLGPFGGLLMSGCTRVGQCAEVRSDGFAVGHRWFESPLGMNCSHSISGASVSHQVWPPGWHMVSVIHTWNPEHVARTT